jgi:3-hydroxyisobutyrate dehydrogenase
MRAGVVGLGAMGGNVAARLAEAGWDVYGDDVDPEAVARAGVRGGLADAGAALPFVLTSLPDDEVLLDVALGADGLIGRMARGSTLVDLSTVLPATIRRVEVAGRARGVRVVDCAVSGGPAEARAGGLVLLVGASDEDLAGCRGVLAPLGTVRHAGAVGLGKTVKLVNNVMTMGNVLIAAEAFALGVRAGVEPERLFEILSGSGGRSHHFLKRFPNVLARRFDPGFSVRLGEKDVRLALELARGESSPMAATEAVHRVYASACERGLAGEDIVAVIKLMEGAPGGG